MSDYEGRNAALHGDYGHARELCETANDAAVLDAIEGHYASALDKLDEVVHDEEPSETALSNRQLLLSDLDPTTGERPLRVAICSLLFNWPSTGGGTVHTFELAKFLSQHGVTVRHLYATHAPWHMGKVTGTLPYPAEAIPFDESDWDAETIRHRFRTALFVFVPDVVVITDSWNTKPLLAEAAAHWPYFIRLAAQELICPLNNVRMLWHPDDVQQCSNNQLERAETCRTCLAANRSSALHQAERDLAGYAAADYDDRLHRSLQNAAGVLAVNPQIAELVRPHARTVEILPSGFDPDRFAFEDDSTEPREGPVRLLFAGLPQEAMKGFHVLRDATDLVSDRGREFELLVTADTAPGEPRAYERFVGWQTQEALPALMRTSDIVVVPTVAQEALGRTAVEAMGAARPVVTSRIGGLPWVVEDGVHGLLADPGDAGELAAAIDRLILDADLRARLGRAGREKFEREFLWPDLIERRYRPLFYQAVGSARSQQ